MAESSLSVGYGDLLASVGFFIGYGSTSANWSTEQKALLNSIVQSGVRRVYYPQAIGENGQMSGYEWSWLHPNETIDVVQAYNTGTILVVNGVVTLTGGSFPTSWTGTINLSVNGISYQVDSIDSTTQITLVNTSVNANAGSIYSLSIFAYDLPDNFGRLLGGLHYPPESYRRPISIISAGRLEDLLAQITTTGTPHQAAVRYKSSDGTSGQRQEIMFFPPPASPWTLSYEYEAYSGALSDTFPYPLGGMQLAELYIESCLAMAETRVNDEIGEHSAQFQALLIDAIARDRKRGAQMYGQMGHREHGGYGDDWRGWYIPPFPITYNGQTL